jgi:hypothetical protein
MREHPDYKYRPRRKSKPQTPSQKKAVAALHQHHQAMPTSALNFDALKGQQVTLVFQIGSLLDANNI